MCTLARIDLQIPLPDVVAMQTRQASLEGTGEITLRQLVREALRMRPSRIIVGEVRQEEALDLLIGLNSGFTGSGVTCDEADRAVAVAELGDSRVLPTGRQIPCLSTTSASCMCLFPG